MSEFVHSMYLQICNDAVEVCLGYNMVQIFFFRPGDNQEYIIIAHVRMKYKSEMNVEKC